MTRLAIAAGDPAGVGPLVTFRALDALRDGDEAWVFGDGAQLASLARVELAPALAPRVHLVDVGSCPASVIDAHVDHPRAGKVALDALDRAVDRVLAGEADVLVTGPVSKAAITATGHAFTGQTEHLARRAGRAADDVTMMFLGPRLRVALVTTHLAIRDVPAAITRARVERATGHLAEVLVRANVPRGSRLVVLGLNPHAGEHGLFGDEEPRVLGPALTALRERAPFVDGQLVLVGPQPAESALRAAQAGQVAGVVAMFHDQATIASKLLDWGHAVNVTWGLPFVRTSVDHGVAFDAARSGLAEADGMRAAVELAIQLSPR